MYRIVVNRHYYIADGTRHRAGILGVYDAPQNLFGRAIESFKVQHGLTQAVDAFSRIALKEQHSGWGEGPGL